MPLLSAWALPRDGKNPKSCFGVKCARMLVNGVFVCGLFYLVTACARET